MLKSRSEEVYDHAIKLVTPFATALGHPWAVVPDGPARYQGWPIYSRRFREWIAYTFFTRHTIYPGCNALDSAIGLLDANARFGPSPNRDIFTRLGHTGDPHRPHSVLVHLANTANQFIEITPSGHQVKTAAFPDSYFLSSPSTEPLPYPARTSASTVKQLQELLDLPTPALHRILIWLFAALRPGPPYPVLVLSGPPGIGTTILARTLRSLIDPSAAPLLAPPSSDRALLDLALHNRVLAFDHITHMPRRLNDQLARLSAGIGYAICGRNVFDDPEYHQLGRPIILTASAPHRAFTTNSIHVRLEALNPAYDIANAAPAVLGSLCAAVSTALSNLANTHFTSVSRFIDVHRWTLAAHSTLGLTPEEINRALAFNPLVDAIQDLLETRPEWTGTATQLLRILRKRNVPNLPSTPKGMSQQLNMTPLAIFGIHLEKTIGVDREIHLTHRSPRCVEKRAA